MQTLPSLQPLAFTTSTHVWVVRVTPVTSRLRSEKTNVQHLLLVGFHVYTKPTCILPSPKKTTEPPLAMSRTWLAAQPPSSTPWKPLPSPPPPLLPTSPWTSAGPSFLGSGGATCAGEATQHSFTWLFEYLKCPFEILCIYYKMEPAWTYRWWIFCTSVRPPSSLLQQDKSKQAF